MCCYVLLFFTIIKNTKIFLTVLALDVRIVAREKDNKTKQNHKKKKIRKATKKKKKAAVPPLVVSAPPSAVALSYSVVPQAVPPPLEILNHF